jgi:hypothetical protein
VKTLGKEKILFQVEESNFPKAPKQMLNSRKQGT